MAFQWGRVKYQSLIVSAAHCWTLTLRVIFTTRSCLSLHLKSLKIPASVTMSHNLSLNARMSRTQKSQVWTQNALSYTTLTFCTVSLRFLRATATMILQRCEGLTRSWLSTSESFRRGGRPLGSAWGWRFSAVTCPVRAAHTHVCMIAGMFWQWHNFPNSVFVWQ